jgi:hypothetical protein
VRRALRAFFARSSTYLVNQEQAPPNGAPFGGLLRHDIDLALEQRWEMQRALDDAVAAVRAGDAVRVITLARSAVLQTRMQCDRSVWAALLALMIESGHEAMLDYVRTTLSGNPCLIEDRFSGHALLHGASAAGNIDVVALLLRLGADPNGLDMGGHAPLYWTANACKGTAGAPVARMLIEAGALVNAAGGVTGCSALHMAARRGNAAVAVTLLDRGADIEARDRRGDTPLRRAVKCGQVEVAALLLARGADRRAQDTRGRTPMLAARTSAMKRVLQAGPSWV